MKLKTYLIALITPKSYTSVEARTSHNLIHARKPYQTQDFSQKGKTQNLVSKLKCLWIVIFERQESSTNQKSLIQRNQPKSFLTPTSIPSARERKLQKAIINILMFNCTVHLVGSFPTWPSRALSIPSIRLKLTKGQVRSNSAKSTESQLSLKTKWPTRGKGRMINVNVLKCSEVRHGIPIAQRAEHVKSNEEMNASLWSINDCI